MNRLRSREMGGRIMHSSSSDGLGDVGFGRVSNKRVAGLQPGGPVQRAAARPAWRPVARQAVSK